MTATMGTDRIDTEFIEIAKKNAWPLVYQKIGRQCQLFPYTCLEAKKPQNKPLNRYRDVNPYDHTRIILNRCDKHYINANLVQMERANRKYILTQGPLSTTVGHFWLMVWEQNSRAILMLNKIIEKNEVKCHWYWPHDEGEEHRLILKDVNLMVEQIGEENFSYYSTRNFRIVDLDGTESREVVQFHYTTWPDFGVPTSPIAFLDFLTRVRASGALSPDVGPPVVHCSAGIGRSGTFCLVDSCLIIVEKEGVDSLCIEDVLVHMRRQRMGLIQTPDQLRFSYQAIIEGTRRINSNWTLESQEESIYALVAAAEARQAPPPPPRGASLRRPPRRPLPALPASTSYDDLMIPRTGDSESSGSASPAYLSPLPLDRDADDEDEEPKMLFFDSISSTGSSGEPENLRRRRTRDLAERLSNMKRKAREAERWDKTKRLKSEEKPQQREEGA